MALHLSIYQRCLRPRRLTTQHRIVFKKAIIRWKVLEKQYRRPISTLSLSKVLIVLYFLAFLSPLGELARTIGMRMRACPRNGKGDVDWI
jgi:hypothetical protein